MQHLSLPPAAAGSMAALFQLTATLSPNNTRYWVYMGLSPNETGVVFSASTTTFVRNVSTLVYTRLDAQSMLFLKLECEGPASTIDFSLILCTDAYASFFFSEVLPADFCP